MNLTPPRPSLPPPQLPAKVVAATRIRVLQAELAEVTEPVIQAALQYEIGALTEHRLGDRETALSLYRAAHTLAPLFRPPLYALLSAAEEQSDGDAARALLEDAFNAARSPTERASVLVDQAVWLERDDDYAPAYAQLLTEALDTDPKCHIAALLLEQSARASDDQSTAERMVDARSALASDPALKSALLVEVAGARERDGDASGALQILRGAASLAQGRWYALEQMERVARLHLDNLALVEALEGRAVLAAIAARDERNRVTLGPRSIRRFRNAEHALQHSAALWRDAARVRALGCHDPVSAQAAYDQALLVFPDNLLLHQEKMFACELANDLSGAAAEATFLLQRDGLGSYAAALHFRIAENAQSTEDMAAVRTSLEAALTADPGSPAAGALLDDWQLDNDQARALIDRLLVRAREHHDPDALLRAIDLEANVVGDLTAAKAIAQRAFDGDHRPVMWRLLLAAAYGARDHRLAADASAQLCELGVSDVEHSVLCRERHHLLRHDLADMTAADALLRAALEDPRCRDWAPDCARLMALAHADYALLCTAHRALAERATDDELRAAHGCAGARASLRAGDEHAAIVLLRDALSRDPTNPYAVALLEDILLRRGEAAEAVQLLRSSANVQADAKRGEIALLHAGAAAEIAGDITLAARSYEESADKDQAALAPLWSLRRLAERTGDNALLLRALEGLAARERNLGAASVAALDVGEHYDTAGRPELAIDPLDAALADRNVGTAAALSLVTLPRIPADTEARDRALTHLQQRMPEAAERAARYERIALRSADGALASEALLAAVLASDPEDRFALLEQTSTADDAQTLAETMRTLAHATTDRVMASGLLLAAGRLAPSTEAGGPDDEQISEWIPESLTAAIAREQSLHTQVVEPGGSSDDDPETLAYALLARADLSSVELAPQQRAAAARLLLRAQRAKEAAQQARSVLVREPDDLATWEVLRAASHLTEDWSGVLEACDALSAHCEGEFRAHLLEEAASVLMDQLQRPEDAELRLREALSIDPTRMVAFDRLHDLLADRQDEAALLELIRARIAVVDDPDELIDLFYEQARLHRSAGDRTGALAWIDSVLMMNEHHLGALGLAAEIHVSMEQWALAAESLRQLARAEGVPAIQKRLSHIAAADFLERRLGDLPAAHAELAHMAGLGLADVALYSRMAALALRIGDTEAAVQSHCSAAQLAGGPERAAHERMAGQLLRERLGDIARATAAYERALDAQSDDIEACAQLLALAQSDEQRGRTLHAFESAVRASMVADPTRQSPWQKLRQLALWKSDDDLHYLVVSAMSALGVDDGTDPEERDRLDARRPANPTGALDDVQLSALRAPDDAGGWAELCVHAAETIASLQRIEPATYGAERKHRIGSKDPHPLRDTVARVIAVFGLQLDHFYGYHKDARAIDVVPADNREHDWIAGTQVAHPLSDRDRFRIAQRAMAIRTRAFPLLPCPREEGADLLYGCAAAAESPFPTVALTGVPLKDAARAMSRRARKAIAQLTPTLDARNANRYVDAANQTCARAGILVTGNLRVALEAILGPDYMLDEVTSNEAARQLVLFSVSKELLALRRRVGTAL